MTWMYLGDKPVYVAYIQEPRLADLNVGRTMRFMAIAWIDNKWVAIPLSELRPVSEELPEVHICPVCGAEMTLHRAMGKPDEWVCQNGCVSA